MTIRRSLVQDFFSLPFPCLHSFGIDDRVRIEVVGCGGNDVTTRPASFFAGRVALDFLLAIRNAPDWISNLVSLQAGES